LYTNIYGHTTTLPLEVFTQRNFVADFIQLKFQTKNRFLNHPLGDLEYVRTPAIVRWKTHGRLHIRHNWTFHYLLRLRRYKWKSVEVSIFQRGWVTLRANFRRKTVLPTNHCWCQKTRVFVLSCGVKNFAAHCLVLEQSTRATDGQTELRLPRLPA